jgi:hypothetical protein
MGSKGQSQMQQVTPPRYAAPYLNTGLSEAARMYNGSQVQQPGQAGGGSVIDQVRNGGFTGGGQLTGGGPVNVNPYQVQGNQMVVDRATGGDPTINAASEYVRNSLGGGFMGANPYLEQTFNRAAQATQGQLASQFAGSGRNVDQSQGNRAQQLGDLASQIYGGAYENDRNRQQASLAYAQPLGNQAYADAAAVGGLQQPEGTALDDYLRRVGAGTYGSTSTQSGGGGFSGGGAMGGALSGFQMGGPWGALAGGVLGGLF